MDGPRLVDQVRKDVGRGHGLVRIVEPRAVVRGAVPDLAQRGRHERVAATRVGRCRDAAPLHARAILGLQLAAVAARRQGWFGQRGPHLSA